MNDDKRTSIEVVLFAVGLLFVISWLTIYWGQQAIANTMEIIERVAQ